MAMKQQMEMTHSPHCLPSCQKCSVVNDCLVAEELAKHMAASTAVQVAGDCVCC